mmetsp:Transcript_51271/g.158063  ORF Transcript_51271/g.158063 Transcript_51271/m.158063 type:complete len:236 (+) Transcript_51271:84-791(+)
MMTSAAVVPGASLDAAPRVEATNGRATRSGGCSACSGSRRDTAPVATSRNTMLLSSWAPAVGGGGAGAARSSRWCPVRVLETAVPSASVSSGGGGTASTVAGGAVCPPVAGNPPPKTAMNRPEGSASTDGAARRGRSALRSKTVAAAAAACSARWLYDATSVTVFGSSLSAKASAGRSASGTARVAASPSRVKRRKSIAATPFAPLAVPWRSRGSDAAPSLCSTARRCASSNSAS